MLCPKVVIILPRKETDRQKVYVALSLCHSRGMGFPHQSCIVYCKCVVPPSEKSCLWAMYRFKSVEFCAYNELRTVIDKYFRVRMSLLACHAQYYASRQQAVCSPALSKSAPYFPCPKRRIWSRDSIADSVWGRRESESGTARVQCGIAKAVGQRDKCCELIGSGLVWSYHGCGST